MKPTKKDLCGKCTNSACECNDCVISKNAAENLMCDDCDLAPNACIPTIPVLSDTDVACRDAAIFDGHTIQKQRECIDGGKNLNCSGCPMA